MERVNRWVREAREGRVQYISLGFGRGDEEDMHERIRGKGVPPEERSGK